MADPISIPGLSSSDNQLLTSLIGKDDAKRQSIDALKANCSAKFRGLAEQLTEVSKIHPDAVAEFLARQPEFREFAGDGVGKVTPDDIKKFVPPHWDTEHPTGLEAAAKYLETMRTQTCADELIQQNFPGAPVDKSQSQRK